jgi:hypothetical protein
MHQKSLRSATAQTQSDCDINNAKATLDYIDGGAADRPDRIRFVDEAIVHA